MHQKKLEKLLIVDDDEDIITVAKYSLVEEKDFSVRYLNSGMRAIQEAKVFHPDLILLDVMMPTMDGITTLKELRKFPELANTPVIFFTAKIQKNELDNYKTLGIIGIIHKPFNPLTFPQTIRDLWNSKN